MIIDIIIVVVVLLFAIYGFRKGFVFTLIQTVGWFVALAVAYIATPYCLTFIKAHTGFFDSVTGVIESKLNVSLDTITTLQSNLPASMQPTANTESDDLANAVASGFAQVFGTVIVFFAIFLIIKLLLWILQRRMSRDYKEGFANIGDGILGGLFGLLRGALLVIIALAIIVPFCTFISADFAQFISTQLDSSHIGKFLYEENPLLILIQAYMAS